MSNKTLSELWYEDREEWHERVSDSLDMLLAERKRV